MWPRIRSNFRYEKDERDFVVLLSRAYFGPRAIVSILNAFFEVFDEITSRFSVEFFSFSHGKTKLIRCKAMTVTGFEPTTLWFRKAFFLISAVIFKCFFYMFVLKSSLCLILNSPGAKFVSKTSMKFHHARVSNFFHFPRLSGRQ